MRHLRAAENPNSYLLFQAHKNPLKYVFRCRLLNKLRLFEPGIVIGYAVVKLCIAQKVKEILL